MPIAAPGASTPCTTVNIYMTVAPPTPFVYIYQLSNTGSYAPPEAPNDEIAPGSLFAAFGDGMRQQTLVQIDLSGSRYTCRRRLRPRSRSSRVTVDALMVYTSSRQVAAIIAFPHAGPATGASQS